jgi:hypothetical protein
LNKCFDSGDYDGSLTDDFEEYLRDGVSGYLLSIMQMDEESPYERISIMTERGLGLLRTAMLVVVPELATGYVRYTIASPVSLFFFFFFFFFFLFFFIFFFF